MFKRKVTCAIVLMSIIVAVTCAYTPVSAANYKSIGVSSGVITTYRFNATTTPAIYTFRVCFESVVGTNATVLLWSYNSTGSLLYSSSKTGNISLYSHSYDQI